MARAQMVHEVERSDVTRRVRVRSGFRTAGCLGLALLVGCASSYDAGSTPREQLCDVLEPVLAGAGPEPVLELEPLIEGAAADPSDLPSALLAIALAYRTNETAYDRLGEYESAVQFTAALVELARGDLIGPSQLHPDVLASALAVDAAVREGACRPPR
jgi:hypothetical protein